MVRAQAIGGARRATPATRLAACVTGIVLLAGAACAQTAQSADTPAETVRIEVVTAANEENLWLAQVATKQSTLFHRVAGGAFDRGRSLNGRVTAIAAVGMEAYLFFDDGSMYRLLDGATGPEPERVLPGRRPPLEVVGTPNGVYALVPATVANGLPSAGSADEAMPRPFESGDAGLAVVAYDGHGWHGLATCPEAVRISDALRSQARLAVARGELWLFWESNGGDEIGTARLDFPTRTWRMQRPLSLSELRSFSAVVVSGVPAVIAATGAEGAAESLTAWRLLPNSAHGEAEEWRAARLEFSTLLRDATVDRYDSIFGFNQHVGALLRDSSGRPQLVFARFGEPSAESTIDPLQVFAAPRIAEGVEGLIRLVTLGVLLAVFTALFVFRRGSMVQAAGLPPGWDLALTLQRLGALAIDLIPFTLAASVVLDLPWLDALKRLASWAMNADVTNIGSPGREVLIWWGLAAGGYVAYSLVLELIMQRTVGKQLLGVRLLTEDGRRPAPWQILVRNLVRVIELLPPFWILAFLVMLTRNRQRLGDVFARTVAVRRVSLAATSSAPGQPVQGSTDSESRTDAVRPTDAEKPAGGPDDRSG